MYILFSPLSHRERGRGEGKNKSPRLTGGLGLQVWLVEINETNLLSGQAGIGGNDDAE
jgi:hypothetical protein